MEIHQLRAFLAAARTGGFGRAGVSLGLTQPTISTTIRKLETELGERLFERLGRRIKLTAAGQALFDASAFM
jgi:LysR family hydrogen peroxide-inducible transcriptional activator